MENPSSMSPGSIMPYYPWLYTSKLDISTTGDKISVLRKLGVPYKKGYESIANDELMAQANLIVEDLAKNGAVIEPDKEIIALIAYLQRLGTDIKTNK